MKNLWIIYLLASCLFYQKLYAQESHTLILDDSQIHFKTFGAGQPILIINGGPGMNSNGFQPLAKQLSKDHLTIIYDQRGTGLSKLKAINATTITMDLMLEDIEHIRKDLKIDSWIILGHSFGGMLASYYAAEHPTRISGLILSSSGGIDMSGLSRLDIRARLTEQQQDSLNYWSRRISSGDTSYHALLQRGKYLAPAYLFNKKNVPIIAERLTEGNMMINSLVFQDLRKIDFDCKNRLSALKVPVLIIQGKEDIIDLQTAKDSQKAFQDAEIFILEGCGHYGWLDQPKEYFGAINSYLSKLK